MRKRTGWRDCVSDFLVGYIKGWFFCGGFDGVDDGLTD